MRFQYCRTASWKRKTCADIQDALLSEHGWGGGGWGDSGAFIFNQGLKNMALIKCENHQQTQELWKDRSHDESKHMH